MTKKNKKNKIKMSFKNIQYSNLYSKFNSAQNYYPIVLNNFPKPTKNDYLETENFSPPPLSTPLKNGYNFKGRFYKTLKTGKVVQIKQTTPIPILKKQSVLNKSKESNKKLRLKLFKQEINVDEALLNQQSEYINFVQFIRKDKLFTKNLLNSRQDKIEKKFSNKSTTTQNFRKTFELYLENLLKVKKTLNTSRPNQNKILPISLHSSKKFKEINEKTNYSNTISEIYSDNNKKTRKEEIKKERIDKKIEKFIPEPYWNNPLLRSKYKIVNSAIKIETDDYENVLTNDNILLTQNLNSKFLLRDPSYREPQDKFFISKMSCNFNSN